MSKSAVGPATLYARIKTYVSKECKRVLKASRFQNLVVFAGNGLTRVAAAMSANADDPSWRKWIAACLKLVGSSRDVDYLTSLNYSLDHILSYAIKEAGERHVNPEKLWESLWDATTSVEPSPLHRAILHIADNIITTNYDDLFEVTAAHEGHRVISRHDIPCLRRGGNARAKKYSRQQLRERARLGGWPKGRPRKAGTPKRRRRGGS